jgi:hypothetical protein
LLCGNWKAFSDAGRPLAVSVHEHKTKRSIDQNKRYWAILRQIAELGWIHGKTFSAEAWHEFFRRYFIGYEDVPYGQMVGISTTTLTVADFADYMTKVEAYAVEEFGIEFEFD